MRLVTATLLCLIAFPLDAQNKPGDVDPTFDLLHDTIVRFGPNAGLFGRGLKPGVRTDGTAGSLRFARELNSKEIAEFENAGIEFRRDGSELRQIAGIYSVFVKWSALPFLKTNRLLVRAEASWAPTLPKPLEVTTRQIGAAATHKRVGGATGRGVVIGDIDSAVDILHPHFFFADAGSYRWIDVDSDGKFSSGDGVDLNDDDTIDASERLRVLDGASVGFDQVTGYNDGFQPHIDWLYADRNDDRERNVGTSAGFTEEDPGYGEPIFVVDDVNANRVLDPNERIRMLGTSKVLRIVTATRSYTRGVDLIESVDDTARLEDAFHGTSVASIAVGGQHGFHDRVGVAPDAQMVIYAISPDQQFEFNEQLDFIIDASQSGIPILLHEWTSPFIAVHDGSGNIEAAMDAARVRGVAQYCPVGNLNMSQKHREFLHTAGVDVAAFNVGEGGPYFNIHGSFFWAGDPPPTVRLETPNGTSVRLTLDATSQALGDAWVSTTYEQTSRGTHHITFYIWTDDRAPIESGDWSFEFSNGPPGGLVYARISDYRTSWEPGVVWAEPLRDHATATFPATADSAFGIAAFGGRHENSTFGISAVDELRTYSGRGPRFDGKPIIDISAPDDPFAALPGSPKFLEIGYEKTWFSIFGGTSGAGPHVAAGAALLLEQTPTLTPDEIEARLRESANTTDLVPNVGALPNAAWGFGKLDIYNALFGEQPDGANQPPSALATFADQQLDASDSFDPDGDTLEYRFDADHDGRFETGWQTEPRFSTPLLRTATFARVDVRDPSGARSGVVLMLAPATVDDVGVAEPEPPTTDPTPCLCRTGVPRAPNSWLLLFAGLVAVVGAFRTRSRAEVLRQRKSELRY